METQYSMPYDPATASVEGVALTQLGALLDDYASQGEPGYSRMRQPMLLHDFRHGRDRELGRGQTASVGSAELANSACITGQNRFCGCI